MVGRTVVENDKLEIGEYSADLATLTEKVRRRVVRWFRIQRLLDADAAAAMLRWENSGLSVDASVRRAAAAEAPAPVPRGVRPESQAQVRRHGPRHRECR